MRQPHAKATGSDFMLVKRTAKPTRRLKTPEKSAVLTQTRGRRYHTTRRIPGVWSYEARFVEVQVVAAWVGPYPPEHGGYWPAHGDPGDVHVTVPRQTLTNLARD